MSTVSTAGWVISVRRSSSSARATAAGSAGSAKTMSDSAPALQQRRHDRVGLVEDVGDDRLASAAARRSMFAYCEPWPVNRKATLPGAAAAAEDAAARAGRSRRRRRRARARAARAPPSPPARRRPRSRSRSARARASASALGGAGSRWRPWRASASAVRSSLASAGVVGRAEHERAAQRRLAAAARRAAPAQRRGGAGGAAAGGCAGTEIEARWPLLVQMAGHVLLHDDVEVRAAEAERADAGDAGAAVRRPPSRAARC